MINVEVEFAYQGDSKDPEVQKFLKGVRSARKSKRVTGCLVAIIMIVAFFLLGKIWVWIFGEPDDGFINIAWFFIE